LAVHDAFSSVGVTRAVLRRLPGRDFVYEGSVGSMVLFRRRRGSVGTALLSATRLFSRLPYFARNIVVKVALRRGWPGVCRMLGHTGRHDPF
jgi:hypothetical protein